MSMNLELYFRSSLSKLEVFRLIEIAHESHVTWVKIACSELLREHFSPPPSIKEPTTCTPK